MLRAILAVIVGYLVAIAVTFVMFAGLWTMLGASGSYEPGTWVLTQKWLLASIAIALIAAVCAGWTCAAIAKTRRPSNVLAIVFFVLGVFNALMVMRAAQDDLGLRPETVGLFEAMQKHREPTWFVWLYPVLSGIGVLIGASFKKKS